MTAYDTDKFLEIFDSLHLNLMQLDDKNAKVQNKETYSYENFSNLLYKLRSNHNWLNGKNYYFLKTCSKIRNIISHSNHMQPFREFNPEYIEKLEGFNAKFFTTVERHSIKRDQINHLNWDSKLNFAIKELKSKNFSCLPILEDGYVQGLFSKSILVDYISEQENCTLTENLTLSDLKEFAQLDKHQGKTIEFIDKDKNLSEVFDMFSEHFAEGNKLILVFLTESGKSEQRILGMYTVWDFLKFS